MNQRVDQLERTRALVIETAAEFFMSEADPAELTMQAIADRAGVSHRTLYRHFKDRQELIDAAARYWGDRVGLAFQDVANFDQWTESIASMVAFGVAHRETLRRGLVLSIATGMWRSDRDELFWAMFRKRFPHLDESEAREDFAILRHVLEAADVVTVGERFGLSPQQLTEGMQRAVGALVSSIAARDDAAVRGED
jgi:AcrR family transcriptional regulator